MGSKGEAPSWADQWGSDEGSGRSSDGKADKKTKTKTVAANMKAAASEGLVNAKEAALLAVVGAHKVMSGTTSGIKWVREQYNKRASSK